MSLGSKNEHACHRSLLLYYPRSDKVGRQAKGFPGQMLRTTHPKNANECQTLNTGQTKNIDFNN
jgi:hypothetical protein